MRMSQSLADLEQAFVEQLAVDRARSQRAIREATLRQRSRHIERRHRHGTKRFLLLVCVLIATAVLVTVAMFETLYYVMG
jgi:hypothetical protein